jgi:hypothetical protein
MTPDFFIIPYRLINDEHLTGVHHRVYATLYWYEHLKDGKCFASNDEIARVAKTAPDTVTNVLRELEKLGYIQRSFFDDGKNHHRQQIKTLISFSVNTVQSTQGVVQSTDVNPSNAQIDRESNIGESNIRESNKITSDPIKPNRTSVDTLIQLYQNLYKFNYGNLPKLPSYPATYKALERILKTHTLAQAGCFMFQHFEWRGMTGNDDFMWDKAYEAGFPLTWLYNNVGQYETYLMANEPTASMWGQDHDTELTKYLDTLCKELFNSVEHLIS